ncbi:lasso peptide biosynthesis B2 protein [Achromobacter spanius]|nr:lasso peptide biosynthesis B2 protein [Achromobacter spanius]
MPQSNSVGSIRELVLGHFREDLVALDLQENRFSIIPDLPVARINAFIAAGGQHDPALATALQEHGLLEKALRIRDELSSYENEGLFETRWTTPATQHSWHNPLLLWRTALTLWHTGIILKTKGYAGVVSAIKNTSVRSRAAQRPDNLQRLMAHLNRAFIIDISSNKCLAYSLALCLLARRAGHNARLVVGVRTRPFASHAWVEINKEVVNDDPNLRRKLAVILDL